MTREEVEAATHSWLAEKRLRAVQDYVDRGRRLERVSGDDLVAEWIGHMKNWAAVAHERPCDPAAEDIKAECSLRGLDLPYDLIRDDIEVILAGVDLAARRIDPEAKQALNEEVFDLYAKEKGGRN